MRIPYGFTLTSSGTLEINRSEHQPTFYTEELFRMIIDRGKNTLNRAPKH